MDTTVLSIEIAEAGTLSLDAIRQTLRAVLAEYNQGRPWEQCAHLSDVIGDDAAGDAIVSINDQLWRVPYSIAASSKSRTAAMKMSKAERVFAQVAYVTAAGIAIEAQRGKLLKLVPQAAIPPVVPPTETEAQEAEFLGEVIPLKEAKGDKIPVRIIAPGQGSSAKYPESALIQAEKDKIFHRGMHCYWNHQTNAEESERPEGDLRDLAATLAEDAKWDPKGFAGPGLYSSIIPTNAYADAVKELAPHIGMSIRAYGISKPGKDGPVLEKFTRGKSVDFVTHAGAGGKIQELFEAARAANPKGEESEMDEAQVKALVEGQVKPLREDLTKMQESNVKLTEANGTLRKRANMAEARAEIQRLLADEKIPGTAKVRVSESVMGDLPLNEAGDLDAAKLKQRVTAAVKAEAEYIKSIGGGSALAGFGAQEAAGDEPKPEEVKSELIKYAKETLGYSEAAAKAYAEGRQ